ncbi:MAG: hypothetical protein ACKOVB_06615 [Terrabacter sp.]
MSRTVADHFPALAVRIVAGPVELRGIDDEDLAVLADLAARGIHPADRMPFYHPWTDAEPDELRTRFVQYHWRCRADFSPARWELKRPADFVRGDHPTSVEGVPALRRLLGLDAPAKETA